jgi:hypothetical protein
MGSEAFDRLGIGRSKEGALDYPDKFTVIGVDIEADTLIKRYKGTRGERYAADVIRAVVQKYRTAGDPPDYFVRTLTGGVNEPILICDLGADVKGKSWAVVIDGRQRCMGLRIVNDRNKAAAPPLPALKVAACFRAFKHDGAGLAAALVKVTSNVRVARTFSQRADDALDLDGRGVGHEDIGPLVEAKDAAEVALLLALASCVDEVKAEVDAGRIPLAQCASLSKCKPEEQVRRVKRTSAASDGRRTRESEAARNAAAPKRAKTRRANVLLATAKEAQSTADEPGDDAADIAMAKGIAAALAWAGGDDAALAGCDMLKRIVSRAKDASTPSVEDL